MGGVGGGGGFFLGDSVNGSKELGLCSSSSLSLSLSLTSTWFTSSRDVDLGCPCNGRLVAVFAGLNDNGGKLFGLGDGIIGLVEGDCLGEERVAFDFFLPNESKFRRGFSSSDGRLNRGG